jgi:RNA polymerase-binding transcription factor DksA
MSQQLEDARRRLLEERERVARLIATRAGAVEESELADDEVGSDTHERADVARSIVESEQQHTLLESLRANLDEIDAALARVDDGTYGVDEVTGEPIDAERLEVFPTARTNVS